MSTEITEETLGQIEAELGRDGVWVAPEMRTQVSKAEEAKIEAAVAEAPTPTYVVLAELPYSDPLTSGDFSQLAAVIRDDTGRTGIYVGVQAGSAGELEVESFPDDPGLYQAARIAKVEHWDDYGAQALRTVEVLNSGQDLDTLLDETMAEHPAEAKKLDSSYGTPGLYGEDDDGGSGWLGLTGAVLGVLVVVAAVATWRKRRRPHRPRLTTGTEGRGFVLPPAVLSTVIAAEERRHEQRAQATVLELGEAIDAAEIGSGSGDAAHDAWQSALDHYDLARRILDRDHSPADVVGALVLAERGYAALGAAVDGREWTPEPPCFFNPLHPSAARKVAWSGPSGKARVWACTACAQAVKAGREPDDVLDFVADGVPRHYFNLDLPPWSSTGYGALDLDLVGALVRR